MSEIITYPTGLTGRIRRMKVREERILADRKMAKAGGQVDELLAACWPCILRQGERTRTPEPRDEPTATASPGDENDALNSLSTSSRCP